MNRHVDRTPTSQKEQGQDNILQDEAVAPKVNLKRRALVQKIAVGSVALACCRAIPAQWTTPLVEFGTLPAHAVTSGSLEELLDELKELQEANEEDDDIVSADDEASVETVNEEDDTEQAEGEETEDDSATDSERIDRTGDIYIDGIIRSKFVSEKLGPEYGESIKIVFDSGEELDVPDTTKDVNYKGMGYRPGGNYTYHKDVEMMEVYAKPGSAATYITIYY